MELISSLLTDKQSQINVVFKLLTEGAKELTPTNIVR